MTNLEGEEDMKLTAADTVPEADTGTTTETGAESVTLPPTCTIDKITADENGKNEYSSTKELHLEQQHDQGQQQSSGHSTPTAISTPAPSITTTMPDSNVIPAFASVQALPGLEQQHQRRQSRQGAFAVGGSGTSQRSASYSITDIERAIDHLEEQQPTGNLSSSFCQQQQQEGGGNIESSNQNSTPHYQSDNDNLIEAELVEEYKVVAAEQVDDRPRVVCQHRKLVAFGTLIILALVASVVALVITGTNSDNSSDSASDDLTDSATVLNNTLEEDDEQVEGPPFCFQSSQELLDAVDAYYWDSRPEANVSLRYGWPMGNWCISHIQDFTDVFKPDRDHISIQPPQPPTLNAGDEEDMDGIGLNSTNMTNLTNLTIAGTTAPTTKALTTEELAMHFQHDIGTWDMSNADAIQGMFHGIQNLEARSWGFERWSTSNIVNMASVFEDTTWANGTSPDLSQWDTSRCTSLVKLFRNSDVRTANISGWDTSNVTEIRRFANEAPNFNEDLSAWDTSSITRLNWVFREAWSFNSDISQWDVSNVESMKGLFYGAHSFTSDISSWDVSKVQYMDRILFGATSFNHDISSWDVSSVENLVLAFAYNPNFKQNLCAWGAKLDPAKVVNITGIFTGTGCPNISDPILAEGGPFCFNCD